MQNVFSNRHYMISPFPFHVKIKIRKKKKRNNNKKYVICSFERQNKRTRTKKKNQPTNESKNAPLFFLSIHIAIYKKKFSASSTITKYKPMSQRSNNTTASEDSNMDKNESIHNDRYDDDISPVATTTMATATPTRFNDSITNESLCMYVLSLDDADEEDTDPNIESKFRMYTSFEKDISGSSSSSSSIVSSSSFCVGKDEHNDDKESCEIFGTDYTDDFTTASDDTANHSIVEQQNITPDILVTYLNNSIHNDNYDNEEIGEQNIRSSSSTSTSTSSSSTTRPSTSIEQLMNVLKARNNKINSIDNTERRIKDLSRARQLRLDRGDANLSKYGIFGLLFYISEIKLDLEWAEDVEFRRINNQPYISWTDFESIYKKSNTWINNFPVFTYIIIASSTFMILLEFYFNNWKIEPIQVNPMLGPSAKVLLDLGALHSYSITGGSGESTNQWYRLVTPMVIHAGIIHYIVNMIVIWFVGGTIERIHGSKMTSFIFLASTIGGNLLSAIFQPYAISVGASGGIFGLVGVCLADIIINWDILFIDDELYLEVVHEEEQDVDEENGNCSFCCGKKQQQYDGRSRRHILILFVLFLEITMNMMIGFTPFVDNFAHLGGFIYGICLALPIIERVKINCVSHSVGNSSFFVAGSTNCNIIRIYSIRVLGVLLTIFFLVVSLLMLSKSDGITIPCKSCLYFTCIPFPFWVNDDNKWWGCY